MLIDTETHVLYRVYLNEVSPERSRIKRSSLHSHDGDMLVDEMDRAGVDQAFLISYTYQDVFRFADRNGIAPEEFVTGKKYARFYFEKHSDRFYWFTTIPDPRHRRTAEVIKADFQLGATGIKVFPALLNIHMSDPSMMEVLRLVESMDGLVMLGLEETAPPDTPSLTTLLEELDEVLTEFPKLRFQLNHAGCVDPLGPDGGIPIRLVRRHENLFLSTALLAYCLDDEHRYPFPNQLRRLRMLYDGVGIEPLLFATDWPWPEHVRKYVQDVDSIRHHCDFLTEDDTKKLLGTNALRYLGRHAKPRAITQAT